MFKLFLLISSLLCSIFFLSACESISVPDGQIAVKNDSQDREYNVVNVSGGGKAGSLSPGQHLILPKGTTYITMSRRYKDYTRTYSVNCPARLNKGIIIKMLDVHVNRIAGGCVTVGAGKN